MLQENPSRVADTGLLPTPPIPADLNGTDLTENAVKVFTRRYIRKGPDGQPAETIEETFWRVAYHVASAEAGWGGDEMEVARQNYSLLTTKRFFPNSPTFTGAGTPLGQLAACFVLPISDDMGRDPAGIFQTLRDAALIQQTGGGNGFAFSRLRPQKSLVNSSAGRATGPVGFLRVYDHAFGEIAQGGCLLPETLVFTDRGLLRLDEIADPEQPGWQPHEIRVATDDGWKDSPRSFNNGAAPILRVTTREGLSLAGTPEHRVKIMTDAGPEWRRLEALEEGDWMLVQLGQHRGVYQGLRHPSRQHGNQVWPKLPVLLDEELAFFLGLLAGDGFTASAETDHRVGVSVAESSYLMKELPALLERVFGVSANIFSKKNDRSVTFVLDNRAVKDFLVLNGLDKAGSKEVRVPRLIRQSPPEVVGAYLRGLFEADGTVSHGYPLLLTSSAALAEETATLLIGLGCPVKIRSVAPGAGRWGHSATYQVRIHTSAGLDAWRERIGCDPRSRFATAYAWESDARRESSYVLPNPAYWLSPVLDEITLPQIDRLGRGREINFRSVRPGLRRAALRYLRGDRNLTRTGYERLTEKYPEMAAAPEIGDLWFVRVSGIEPEGEALTLDLEVEENHTYLANGVVTHNTRRGANMAVLRCDHPDVEEFIGCKTDENAITNFNISVGITDAFMQAVRDDADWDLRFPDVRDPAYKKFNGTLEEAEAAGIPIVTHRTVRARDLFNKIVTQAHHNGEPGMLFLDAANRTNPVPHLYQLEATNPCVTGDTLIFTSEGLKRADQLADEGEPNRVVIDGRMADDPLVDATHVFPTGIKDVFRLTTIEGYEVRLTADHKIKTDRGWIPATDLMEGDAIHILNRRGSFGEIGIRELGLVLGWLVGDGTVNHVRAVLSFFGEEKAELAPMFANAVTRIVDLNPDYQSAMHRSYPVGLTEIESRDEVRIQSDRLRLVAAEYGLDLDKLQVPEIIFTATEETQRAFLQALFTADGTVNNGGEKGCSVRLTSVSGSLLKDVQRLLLNFGIASKIYLNRRNAGVRRLPDGKGGLAEYWCQAYHELAISKDNLLRFAQDIGFLSKSKQAVLIDHLSGMIRGPYRESFTVRFESLVPDGQEMVYDLHEPLTHSYVANGLIIHNCGEQWLGPAENCCLGSINLAQHFGPDGTVDREKLRETTETTTRFLDDVVEKNAYVPAVPALKEAAFDARRIGLGIMGLADLMYYVGVRYGSRKGQEFGAQVMEFVRYHCMRTSIKLAEERGPFRAIKGSIYDPENVTWTPPKSHLEYLYGFGRPELDWDLILAGIREHGIRNAAQTTVAPTGTIATAAGCEGYGCEPVFALAYIRHVNDNGQDLQLTYTSPLFDQALEEAGLDDETRAAVVDEVMAHGTCQDVDGVPAPIREVFVVSADITAEEHVRMQAALQDFVDNSLSKTVNFPAGATEEDVATAYQLAWDLDCKGITVYVTGSRDKVVLETHATAREKEAGLEPLKEKTLPIWHESKKPRPKALPGATYQIGTPLGKAFVTVNENGGEQPFEVFITTAKAGSETAAVSEAIGRLVSFVLRLASPVAPRERLREVIRQLAGIGGGRPLGFGPNRVRSLPDGVAQALSQYIEDTDEHPISPGVRNGSASISASEGSAGQMKIGDLCPDCGEAAVVNEEGCRKCYACGYSEC